MAEAAEDAEEAGGTADIKSNNPHLTGGEQEGRTKGWKGKNRLDKNGWMNIKGRKAA